MPFAGEREVLAGGLETLATTAVVSGNPRQVAQLGGVAEAIWWVLQVTRSPGQHNMVTLMRAMAVASEQLTAAEFAVAWGGDR